MDTGRSGNYLTNKLMDRWGFGQLAYWFVIMLVWVIKCKMQYK